MTFSKTILEGSYTIEIKIHEDERGWFGRYYCKNEFKEIGHEKNGCK